MNSPDILYLVHRLPFPPDKGDRIRTYHLLAWLARRARVHVACLADEPVSAESVAALEKLCFRVAVVPLGLSRWARAFGALAVGRSATEGAFHSPALEALLRRWALDTQFRVVMASASSMAPYLRLPELSGVPAVVDLVDLDSQKWLDYAAGGRGPKAWLHGLEGRRVRGVERMLTKRARALTLVSAAEADLCRSACGDGPIYVITNGVDLDAFCPSPVTEERGCVFVGALDYRPNVEGADWFCREPWPEIRRRRPETTIALVGRRPVPAVRHLSGLPGVEVIGQVPDVRPYLAGAAVAVVPLQIARGVQNKVLEAMAMGKAVVASPEALTGLGVEPGVHALSASTPEQWTDAVVGLLGDPDRRRLLGARARAYVETHHHWDRCLDPFGPLLDLPAQPSHPSPLSCPASREPSPCISLID